MIKSGISTHLITLLSCKDKHLRLGMSFILFVNGVIRLLMVQFCRVAALRYFRVHLKRRNKNFNGHLIKIGVFKALLDLTLEESHRDTLINSCCLELFDSIRAVRSLHSVFSSTPSLTRYSYPPSIRTTHMRRIETYSPI